MSKLYAGFFRYRILGNDANQITMPAWIVSDGDAIQAQREFVAKAVDAANGRLFDTHCELSQIEQDCIDKCATPRPRQTLDSGGPKYGTPAFEAGESE